MTEPMLSIRAEVPADAAAVRAVNLAAFGEATEADLVAALHAAGVVNLALVAVRGGEVVGHILFSPVTIERAGADAAAAIVAVGLAPMAVRPVDQRTGIGSCLVRAGLDALRAAGVDAVVVVGHPPYYPRFGFVPASRFGLRWELECPDDVFMALELRAGALASVADAPGVVRYHATFAAV